MDGREGESVVRPRRSKALTGMPIYKVTRRSMKHAGGVFAVGEWETEVPVYANRGILSTQKCFPCLPWVRSFDSAES